MATKSNIVDGTGSRREARVTADHALLVTSLPSTTMTEEELIAVQRRKVFQTFLIGDRPGTGDTIGGAAPNMTLTDAGGAFQPTDVGLTITIAGATTPANNGTFTITGWTSATVITYTNVAGVAQAFPGTYVVNKTFEMLVNGSVAGVVNFSLPSISNKIVYCARLRFLFADVKAYLAGTGAFRDFGSIAGSPGIPALTNGLLCAAVQRGVSSDVFTLPVRQLGDFLNYSEGYTSIDNAISSTIDFTEFDIDFPEPLILAPGTTDRITVTIRDNLSVISAAGTFLRAIARGYTDDVES
jgi:hypothetical protein